MSTRAQLDPLTLGVLWRGLTAVANDAGLTLRQTAYSEAVREGRDFSVGIFDARARMVAQGDFSPGHLGSMPSAVENIVAYYPIDEMQPGDAIVLNDLYMGSGHLPDFFLMTPLFHQDKLAGFAVNCVHMIDVGGAAPGSQAVVGIFDHYQEGIRFLPTRVWHADQANDEILRVLEANVRVPHKLLGDLKAMRNCNRIAERRLSSLIDRYGIEKYEAATDEILERSERAMRDAIAAIPNGTYHAVDWFDDSGPDTDPLRIEVTVSVDHSTLTIDFDGSSPQTSSGINGISNYVRAFCYFTIKCLTHGPTLPQNAGSLRPITVTAPAGSIANASPPAGAGARAIMQQRFVDVLMQALAGPLAERVLAPSSHWANPIIGGTDARTGRRFVFYDIIVGGFGGRPDSDGVEAMTPSFNIDGIPTEVNEQSYPVVVERLELIPDSAGAGKNRGGHGLRKDVKLLADSALLSNLTDRQRFAPPGILGGQPGALGKTLLYRDGDDPQPLHSKGTYTLQRNDVVSTQLSGGGGYGDPLERDPELVRLDVTHELVSPAKAREAYGVIFADDVSIDSDATRMERARRQQS